jgi:hypothetical protein
MSRHTPGPWEAVDYDLDAIKERFGVLREDIVTITNTTSPSGMVMIVAPYVQGERAEWHARNFANAQLIAAAPDLLAALQAAAKLLSTAEDCLAQLGEPMIADKMDAGEKAARAAIAKATEVAA